jgi:sulfate permease, SulP family
MSTWWVPPTLRSYQVSWLRDDVLAALTLVAVALPSQMATARLANLPAVDGLYAFVAGTVLFAIFGTNPHLSIGADSTIAPVLAVGVASLAVAGTSQYGTTMAYMALMVGAVLIIVGLCRLGWIADFLSTPVITGVLAGIAVEIAVRQLPVVLGLSGGGTTTIGRLQHVFGRVGHTNGWSLGIALGVLALIVGAQRHDRRLPGALLGLVLSIAAVHVLSLASMHGVAVIGHVRGGPPPLRFPSLSFTAIRRLVAPVLTVAFLCIAQTAAIVRRSRAVQASPGDFNRDLIGIGAGSLAAGLVGSFAVDASPPNTAITTASGAKSQLTNLVAAAVIFAVLLVLTAPLANLPQAALGATLLFIATKLFRVGDLRTILRFDRVEFGVAIVTLLVVALVGIEQGVVLAMIFSLADRTRRSARPRDAVLGREPGTDHWIPSDIGRLTEQVSGVLVYLVYAPIWYGNAEYIALRIRHLIDFSTEPVRAVVLDANGVSDIDFTGLEALRDLATELRQHGTTIAIARASHLVHHALKHGALLDQLGANNLFASVESAVAAFTSGD